MSAVILACGQVFDNRADRLTGPAEILVEGNRITALGRTVNRPAHE